MEIVEGTKAWREAIEHFDSFRVPTFEPSNPYIQPLETVSILIHNGSEIVAVSAGLVLQTSSLMSEIECGRLWGLPSISDNRTHVFSHVSDFSGRIGYSGGTYVTKQLAGQRFGILLTRVIRSYAADVWKCDSHAGMVFEPKASVDIPYHYESIEQISDGVPIKPYSSGACCLLSSSSDFHTKQIERDRAKLPVSDLRALTP